MDGVDGAEARVHFFLYNCSADSNLAWAKCVIMDDEGAVHKTDWYKAKVTEEPVEEVEPEPETPVEPENPEEETPTEEPVVEGE